MPDQGSLSDAAHLPRQSADHPMACPQQALYGEAQNGWDGFFPAASVIDGADSANESSSSTAKGTKCGYSKDTEAPEAEMSSAAAAPQADQALAGVAQEVQLDDSELCAEPFADFGALVVTAPPWKPYNIVSRRLFSLVLRNPRNPRTGLILMSSTSQSLVTQTTEGILAELGASSVALSEASFYNTLLYDPALLAAVALCSSASDGGNSLQQLLGGMTGNFSNEGPSESALASESASASSAAAPAGVAQQPHPEEEHGECPICYEAISAGDAAMRCSGDGGIHHYFHAACLQQWIRQCRSGQSATCPVCRGTVQFNGQRLDAFLQSPSAGNLDEEERTFLKSIADGLQHTNAWSDMSNLERGAFTVGIAAAAGWGFMVGYHGDSHAAYANNQLVTPHLGRDHNIAQGVGWVAGLLARIIREATRERRRDNDRS